VLQLQLTNIKSASNLLLFNYSN